MKRIGTLALGVLAALAAGAMLASTAGAEEYNLHSLPELGRCMTVKTAGEYHGRKCVVSSPGSGHAVWRSGPGANRKYRATLEEPINLETQGGTKVPMHCISAELTGEYTGPKNMSAIGVLHGCQTPAAGAEKYCQNTEAAIGDISIKELAGELGYVLKAKHPKVGWDLRPASGSNIATFECGGGNEIIGKGLGTGTAKELQGSVIGNVVTLDAMSQTNEVSFIASGTKNVPERLEGGVPDTLTMLVGSSKTAEPATLAAKAKITNQEALEILSRCKGNGC